LDVTFSPPHSGHLYSAIAISFALIIGSFCGAVYGKLGYFLKLIQEAA
jgi:hypothetical protein